MGPGDEITNVRLMIHLDRAQWSRETNTKKKKSILKIHLNLILVIHITSEEARDKNVLGI